MSTLMPCINKLHVSSYVVQLQTMRGQCAAYHFQVKRSNVMVSWVVLSFCHIVSVAPCLFDRFVSYVAQMQARRERRVENTFKTQGEGHVGCCNFYRVWHQQIVYQNWNTIRDIGKSRWLINLFSDIQILFTSIQKSKRVKKTRI